MKFISKTDQFREYEYKTEEEFERDIVANSKKIFGEKTYYIDIKKLIKGKNRNGCIPDGYLLDYTVETKPRLYLVENELKSHSIRDHIAPQLIQFAFNYKHNILEIKDNIIENMLSHNIDVDKIAMNAGYRNGDAMLTDIIYKEKLGVIIPIDNAAEDLKELKNLFRFDIEILQFKKYYNGTSIYFACDDFHEEINTISTNIATDDIDTILVPAEEEGFEREFIGNNRWYSIAIGINMLDKLKYIAVYQKSPIKAITYYAEISHIDIFEDTGKYIIYFKDKAKKLKRPIPLNPENPNKAPQARVYTNVNKILNADKKTTLDDIF